MAPPLLAIIELSPLEIIIVLVILIIFPAIPRALYILTLQNTMKKIAPENREGTIGSLWLELIPVFNWVWQFYNVNNVTRSLEKEFFARGIQADVTKLATQGRTKCILVCCSLIPYIGSLIGIAALVFWIIFWSNVVDFKRKL